MNKKIFTILGAVFALILGGIILFSSRESELRGLRIHVFDAGKADAILISNETEGERHYVLIDTGESNLFPTIQKYFEKEGIEKLDALIISHFDKDHVGSAGEIIRNFQVSQVFQTNTTKDSDEVEAFLAAIKEKGNTPETIADENSVKGLRIGEMEFLIQGPEKNYKRKESNNSSLIVKLKYKNTSYLFMGDAETERLEDFLETELGNGTYDFLKVPYHGHFQENLEELIKEIQPKYAVITSSFKELEDKETRRLLEGVGAKVYLARQGSIDVFSDGEKIEIRQ
ncbi:MBL fold metallo-hydrolase [Candidatus Saccharibacteria bacterium]|nr:MBL fold metallo-hydrolase [Candidatus Saccharibacteria bacterium]